MLMSIATVAYVSAIAPTTILYTPFDTNWIANFFIAIPTVTIANDDDDDVTAGFDLLVSSGAVKDNRIRTKLKQVPTS